ncbi:alpha/beta fold hydrolase [Streptosporangiaceae bacterium NEAU-GS5]|nr:alpha/beta fold hydrolase [Streptosporangiaceae bacterium NEAU-GS5]
MAFPGGKRGVASVASLAAALVLGVVVWAVWPSGAAPRPENMRISVLDGPNGDQPVSLDATFFPPAGGGKAPAVLLAHGFGGSKMSVRDQAARLAGDGYAVLTWSARGFGRSTGEITLDSPDYDVRDVEQLISWLAKRPEVRLDAPGDPRVGIAGGSYGGGIALMTAAYDKRVDAIAPSVTWNDLSTALFPDAAGGGPENGVFKRMWAGIFFSDGSTLTAADALDRLNAPAPAAAATDEQVRCGRWLPAICDVYQKIAETGRATPEAVSLLRRSSPVSVPGGIRIPTLLIQGQRDSLFPLSQADANARQIAATGAPVDVAWIDGGHDGGDAEIDYVYDLTRSWFDRWLDHATTPASAGFAVSRDGGRDPGTRRPTVVHASAGTYPGLTGTARRDIAITGPEQPIANPPGGSPAGITSVPGVGGLLSSGGGGVALDIPGQSAVFESAPLAVTTQITGSATVRIRVQGEGEAVLFAKLYDAGDGALATLPQSLAAPLRVAATPEGTVATITLPAIDHRFDAGRRMRLVLSTTDLGYSTPAAPAVHHVALAVPALTVPLDAALVTPATGPAWWTWALPLAAILIAAAIVVTGRPRRGPAEPPSEAAAETPLVISGLSKRYRNGETAVDDLSFEVRKGQVLGLLGPNGAGKTTTMRMLMGLIHPDAGEVRIFGERVVPGAPVLSRLGSFVEGPGFLPHLTGRDNLDLYWKATGRPAADAHLEEALEIAGLGAALDRAVRTYSHGMRQRLAIAQAMLGLPDLLVLDEPTNGLDPPQIAEMRRVLTTYAENGRTVIVSSHLLAEVEQTCTHVVVMHRGRLVSAGPVSTLLASGNGVGPRLEDVFLTLIGEPR